MGYADIPSKRIEAHSRICAVAVAQTLARTMLFRQPADRTLSAMLKKNHQFGARDRRIISETLFSVLRWWGWLWRLAPGDFLEIMSSGEIPDKDYEFQVHAPSWYGCFAAAWLLEGRLELPPSASWWLVNSGIRAQDIPELPGDADMSMRRKLLRPFYGNEMPPLTAGDLIPEWAASGIACDDLDRLVEWQQKRPPLWLRAQTNDIDRIIGTLAKDDVKLIRHGLMKHALKSGFAGVNLRQTETYRTGKFEVQDIASQAVSLIASPEPGQLWWDCCAGAGGKTLHLAWLMKGKGRVQATDKRTFKLDELKTRAARCGLSNIHCGEWLGIEVKSYAGKFHGVLVDVPCSCSGTWRRNPDLRWTTEKQDAEKMPELQLQLLTNASRAVAPGGTLIYATCSMFKMENQDVVTAFLENNRDFELMPFCSPLDGKETDGMLQTWPWDADCDAMFMAKMIRKSN